MRIQNWLFALAVLFVCSLSVSAQTATTYDSVDPTVNVGDPSWVTFYFGHSPNGEPGTTALIIQCAFHRAELITNFDVYGLQLVSQFFAIACTENVSYVRGQRVSSFTVNGFPLTESLVMYGRDANGNPVTQHLNLGVANAAWTVTGSGRYATNSGSARITY